MGQRHWWHRWMVQGAWFRLGDPQLHPYEPRFFLRRVTARAYYDRLQRDHRPPLFVSVFLGRTRRIRPDALTEGIFPNASAAAFSSAPFPL